MGLIRISRATVSTLGMASVAVLLAACGGGGDGGGGSVAQPVPPTNPPPPPASRVEAAFVPGATPKAWWINGGSFTLGTDLGASQQQADGSFLRVGTYQAPTGITTAGDVAGNANYAIGTWASSPVTTYVVYNSPATAQLPSVGSKTCTTLAQTPTPTAKEISATLSVTSTNVTLAPAATVASKGLTAYALPALSWSVATPGGFQMISNATGTSRASLAAGGPGELLVVYAWSLPASYGTYGATNVLSCK